MLESLKTDLEKAAVELSGCPMVMELRQGWEVRRSGLEHDLLYFCLEGGFAIHGRRRVRTVRAGDAVIVPAGTPLHCSLGALRRARIARFRLSKPAGRTRAGCGVMMFRFGRTTGVWLTALRAEVAGDLARSRSRRISTALSGLFASLELPARRRPERGGQWRLLSSSEKERIRTWAEELEPQSRPGLGDLAEILKMSPDYCARLFRQSFGQSFEKWIIDARMRSAALRISESALTIGAIAAEFGFSTPYFFSRQFKEVMGCSPRKYREDQTC